MQQIKANVDIPEENIKNVAHQSWLDGFSTLLIQHINTGLHPDDGGSENGT